MTDQSNKDGDDITLSSIKNGFVSLFLMLYSLLEYVYLFILKNALIITICTVLAGTLGYFMARRTKPIYSLSMIVKHNDLAKRTYAESIEQINNLAVTRSHKQLCKVLGLSETLAKKVKTLKTYSITGDPLLDDTSTRIDMPFTIKAEVYDNLVADSLEQKLIDYFNTNPYLRNRKEIQKKIYEEKLVFIANELNKLDSLKSQYNHFLSTSGKSAMFYNNAFNPAEIYQRSSEYHAQKEIIVAWLNNEYQTVKVIEGFKPSVRPVDGKRELIILYFTLAGILLGCIIGLLRMLHQVSKRKSG